MEWRERASRKLADFLKSPDDARALARLRRPKGNCYVACEALFHLLGGKAAGWKPYYITFPFVTHWFLRHESGLILDPTIRQFTPAQRRHVRLCYGGARACGFLTRAPSRRARELMRRIVWQ